MIEARQASHTQLVHKQLRFTPSIYTPSQERVKLHSWCSKLDEQDTDASAIKPRHCHAVGPATLLVMTQSLHTTKPQGLSLQPTSNVGQHGSACWCWPQMPAAHPASTLKQISNISHPLLARVPQVYTRSTYSNLQYTVVLFNAWCPGQQCRHLQWLRAGCWLHN
jgi:hypothetical protein